MKIRTLLERIGGRTTERDDDQAAVKEAELDHAKRRARELQVNVELLEAISEAEGRRRWRRS